MTRTVEPYVQRCLDAFDDPQETPDGWVTTCSSVTHGSDGTDSSPSLRVTVGQLGRVLLICRVGCHLNDVLDAAGLTYKDLFPRDGEFPQEPFIQGAATPAEEDLAFRHTVYTDLIAKLGLDLNSRRGLKARGLTDTEIVARGYRAILHQDLRSAAIHLATRHGLHPLLAVPGFTLPTENNPLNRPSLSSYSVGLAIPCRDIRGRIHGIKIRKFEASAKSKYIQFSSFPDGPLACSDVHIPLGRDGRDLSTIRVTEGELKADVASILSPIFTIGAPGGGNWRKVLPALAHLAPKRVLVTLDWADIKVKPGVAGWACDLFAACQAAGYETGLESWDAHPDSKGIDDLLVAGGQPIVTWGAPALATLNQHAGRAPTHLSTAAETPEVSTPYAWDCWDPPAFPTEVFPTQVRDFVLAVSDKMKCPPDFAALSVLTTASRAIGTSRVIEMEGGWKEWAVLYSAVVAPPGNLKTPAMKRAVAPILALQRSLSATYEAGMREYRQYQADLKEAKERGEDRPKKVAAPPPLENLYTQDFTTESLVDMLHDNGTLARGDSSVLLYCDELMQWLNNLNAYRGGKGADRQMFLSFWSCEQYKKNRKMQKETITMANPFCAVLGSIQPDMLPNLRDAQGREDGFIHRILFAFPRPQAPYEPDADTPRPEDPEDLLVPQDPITQEYNTVIKILLSGLRREGGEPKVLRFTPAGWTAWLAAASAHTRDTEQQLSCYHSPWSKMRAYHARLVMILHYLRVACADLGHSVVELDENDQPTDTFEVLDDSQADEQDVANASLLINYFKAHYKGVLQAVKGYGPEERRIEEFVTWVRSDSQSGKCTLKDVYSKRLHGCKGRADAARLFRLAEDRGYGKALQAPGPNSKNTTWFIAHTQPAPSEESA